MSDTCPICGGPNPDIGSHWCWRCRNAARTGARIEAAKSEDLAHKATETVERKCWVCHRVYTPTNRMHFVCSDRCRHLYVTRVPRKDRVKYGQLNRTSGYTAFIDCAWVKDARPVAERVVRRPVKGQKTEQRRCWICGMEFTAILHRTTHPQRFCSRRCGMLSLKVSTPAERREWLRRCEEAGGYVYIDLRDRVKPEWGLDIYREDNE